MFSRILAKYLLFARHSRVLYQNYDLINHYLTVILYLLWTLASLHIKQEFKKDYLSGPSRPISNIF